MLANAAFLLGLTLALATDAPTLVRRFAFQQIEARTGTGQTGAAWQRQALTALEPRLGRRRALTAVLERYLDHQRTGHPVHTWPLPGPGGG